MHNFCYYILFKKFNQSCHERKQFLLNEKMTEVITYQHDFSVCLFLQQNALCFQGFIFILSMLNSCVTCTTLIMYK